MSDWEPTQNELRALRLLKRRPANDFVHRPIAVLDQLRRKGWAYGKEYETVWRGRRFPSYETTITDDGRKILDAFS